MIQKKRGRSGIALLFSAILPFQDKMTDLDAFYKGRTDSVETVSSKFRIKVGKTLSERKWKSAFDAQGRVDISKVLIRIQKGGVHPLIRGEVWEFLLGCYDLNSTFKERASLRKTRREQYEKLKAVCQGLDSSVGSGTVVTLPRVNDDGTPAVDANGGEGADEKSSYSRSLAEKLDQKAERHQRDLATNMPITEARVNTWRSILHQVGLDVVRTDRTLEFYEKDENLSRLWDVLAVYAWVDPDIGYCQGMSDLCSPMVVIFRNEADAFWCFERLMNRLRENFRCTERAVGVQKQLENLGDILRVVDPKLHNHLEELGGGNYIFAFRMLMVLFRREFSFGDSLFLWEMMWALEFNPRYTDSLLEGGSQNPGLQGISKQDFRSGWLPMREKTFYKWGKFERQNIKYGSPSTNDLPFIIFCAAGIFENQREKLNMASGLDEVLKILNDTTGQLDAMRACKEALSIHKKYLLKVKKV